MNNMQDSIPMVSWSCFYDNYDGVTGTYFVSSAPTFQATQAALASVLRYFLWKYIVLVVYESERLYEDLAAHVTYAISDDADFAVERVVHLTSPDDDLSVLSNTAARGFFINSELSMGP